MPIYLVRIAGTDADAQPVHIRDDREPPELARALVTDGFLVSEAVRVRQSFTKYNDGTTIWEARYFSADPLGRTILLEDHVVQLSEVVVPPDAQPMPD